MLLRCIDQAFNPLLRLQLHRAIPARNSAAAFAIVNGRHLGRRLQRKDAVMPMRSTTKGLAKSRCDKELAWASGSDGRPGQKMLCDRNVADVAFGSTNTLTIRLFSKTGHQDG